MVRKTWEKPAGRDVQPSPNNFSSIRIDPKTTSQKKPEVVDDGEDSYVEPSEVPEQKPKEP